MKSPLDVLKSQKIVNEILNKAYHAINTEFDKFVLEVEYKLESRYTGARLELLKNGSRVNATGLVGDFFDSNLIRSLCELMKDENGKSWTSFVLTYENGGQANIEYDYNPLPEE